MGYVIPYALPWSRQSRIPLRKAGRYIAVVANAERQELLRDVMGLMTARELMLRLRVSPSTLDEWLSGEAPIPDGVTFVLIAVLSGSCRANSQSLGASDYGAPQYKG